MSLDFLKSPPGQDPVVVEGHFNTSAARLFRTWTDPDELMQWFGPSPRGLVSARLDVEPGGIWECAFPAREGRTDKLTGEYLAVKQDSRLVFTWEHHRAHADGAVEKTPASLVTVTFTDTPRGARLHLLHERIEEEGGRLGVTDGWRGSFARIAALFEA